MKILFLIISSDTETVYDEHRKVWRSYMHSNKQIESYFIQYRDGAEGIDGDTLWLNGKESFQNIITKTIDSIEYFLNKDNYDFIIRTNLSSLWNFNALINYIKTLPTENVYNGVIGKHNNSINFISGSGMIISKDVADLLIKNRIIAENVKIIDDVDIGYTMMCVGIKCSKGYRVDIINNTSYDSTNFSQNDYHYRIKFSPELRHKEPEVMRELLGKFSNIESL